MKANDAKKLKELKGENARLKQRASWPSTRRECDRGETFRTFSDRADVEFDAPDQIAAQRSPGPVSPDPKRRRAPTPARASLAGQLRSERDGRAEACEELDVLGEVAVAEELVVDAGPCGGTESVGELRVVQQPGH